MPKTPHLSETRPRAEPRFHRLLLESVTPYWLGAVDRERGGYWIDDAPTPRSTGKQLVEHARLIWTFSHLHRYLKGEDDGACLEAARHGVDFLRGTFFDRRNGGYYDRLDEDDRPSVRSKSVYGQAVTVMALVEYGRAADDALARSEAECCFANVNSFMRHPSGGWLQWVGEDWSLDRSDPYAYDRDVDTHCHLTEALTSLVDAGGPPEAREALTHSINVSDTQFFPADPRQWRSTLGGRWYRRPRHPSRAIRLGLVAEVAWFDVVASRALGQAPDLEKLDRRLDVLLDHGFDWDRGGLFHRFQMGNRGPVNLRTKKTFWAQAELTMALLTSIEDRTVPRHQQALDHQINFVTRFLSDPSDGVWYECVDAAGVPLSTRKAGSWKAGQHEVRALVALAALERSAWRRPQK